MPVLGMLAFSLFLTYKVAGGMHVLIICTLAMRDGGEKMKKELKIY